MMPKKKKRETKAVGCPCVKCLTVKAVGRRRMSVCCGLSEPVPCRAHTGEGKKIGVGG